MAFAPLCKETENHSCSPTRERDILLSASKDMGRGRSPCGESNLQALLRVKNSRLLRKYGEGTGRTWNSRQKYFGSNSGLRQAPSFMPSPTRSIYQNQLRQQTCSIQ